MQNIHIENIESNNTLLNSPFKCAIITTKPSVHLNILIIALFGLVLWL